MWNLENSETIENVLNNKLKIRPILYFIVSLKDFKILASNNSKFHLKIKESLLIARDKPELNRNKKSLPLYLFD